MSKLLKLKKWLTLTEAVNYISTTLSEPITQADLLRLALDKHLVMSVNLVNGASAYLGEIVQAEDITFMIVNEIFGSPTEFPFHYPVDGSLSIDGKRYIKRKTNNIESIRGVWDLTLLGSENIDLEFYYEQLTSGVEITNVGLEGVFLQQDGVIAQLLANFNDNEYDEGSKAYCDKIEASINHDIISNEEVEKIRLDYKQKRANFLQRRQSKSIDLQYYPSGGLDDHDYVFVVRTAEINRFLNALNDDENPQEDNPSTVIINKQLKIRTPEESLIDSLGLMAWLLSKKSNIFERNEKPNASQIQKAVEASINDLGLNDSEHNSIMITNLNRDITNAINQLKQKLTT
ncbi:hypothetical protein ACRN9A_06735 [Shewanella frigidimarina]|uniref:hypothetical protein n=1 Tax=Shewanella frigidimarina TaxID=56812 RepID=UPI003D7B1114